MANILLLNELLVLVGIIIVFMVLFLVSAYRVVPPHQAHVVVNRGKGRKVYCAREGFKSSYWRVPFVQQRSVIPLENIQLRVDDIPLRDKNMAKFLGDVVAWLNVSEPLVAAERIGRITSLEEIKTDVTNVIQAVTRNSSMYWTIIDIITKRKDFSTDIEKAVNEELKSWGMTLVELEVIHFDDIQGYTVVQDLEKRQGTVINAETRKLIASQQKEASIVETTAQKDAEVMKAQNEEIYRIRQVQKDESVAKRSQEMEMNVAEQTQKANQKKIEAERTSVVGKASYEKDATITRAEGEAAATVKKGEANAKVTQITGEAEGNVIRAKGFAEADATDKRAEALKKYNEAGITLEIINATKTVNIAQATAWQEALKAAKIQVYSGGEGGTLFGMPITPQSGFNLGAFAEVAKEHGIDLQKIAESIGKGTLPVADVTRVLKPDNKGDENVK